MTRLNCFGVFSGLLLIPSIAVAGRDDMAALSKQEMSPVQVRQAGTQLLNHTLGQLKGCQVEDGAKGLQQRWTNTGGEYSRHPDWTESSTEGGRFKAKLRDVAVINRATVKREVSHDPARGRGQFTILETTRDDSIKSTLLVSPSRESISEVTSGRNGRHAKIVRYREAQHTLQTLQERLGTGVTGSLLKRLDSAVQKHIQVGGAFTVREYYLATSHQPVPELPRELRPAIQKSFSRSVYLHVGGRSEALRLQPLAAQALFRAPSTASQVRRN